MAVGVASGVGHRAEEVEIVLQLCGRGTQIESVKLE